LPEQQDSGEQIADGKRGFVSRYEGADLLQRNPGGRAMKANAVDQHDSLWLEGAGCHPAGLIMTSSFNGAADPSAVSRERDRYSNGWRPQSGFAAPLLRKHAD
jgi:hypothetical protein